MPGTATGLALDRRKFLLGLAAAGSSIGALHESSAAGVLGTPQKIEISGVGNLYQVTDRLFRGAQPTREGFHALAARQKIRTIVNLREFHDDGKLAGGLGLALRRVKINTWHIGDDKGEKIVRALRFIREGEKRGRVMVHCQHGSDRTGAIVALYRIAYQGWNKERAIDEMMNGSFGFHPIWAALPEWGNIPAYIRKADIAVLKARVGMG